MQAHASQRGVHALDALTDVLKTMSVRLVETAFLRVDLLGKTPDQLRSILGDAGTQAVLAARLRRFAQGDRAGRRARLPIAGLARGCKIHVAPPFPLQLQVFWYSA